MSESAQVPPTSEFSPDESRQTSLDDVIRQFERARTEMQLTGQKLHRQMQEYQAMLDEVERLENSNTPEARTKLQRLAVLVASESFQRDEREIKRMSFALAHAIAKLKEDAPNMPSVPHATPTSKRASSVPRA